jgi:exodeoxyribonuclease V alpha subunit
MLDGAGDGFLGRDGPSGEDVALQVAVVVLGCADVRVPELALHVYKSQGSQFGTATVMLPPPSSRILTRELLYTALTRARERLLVVGTEATIRAAVERSAARASGLRERLLDA